jgi:hypothetical protein
MTEALRRIAALRAEIESLRQTGIGELTEKRNALSRELAQVDAELAELTGRTFEPKPRTPRAAAAARSVPLQELKELLAAAPGKTLNLRKAGLEVHNVKVLADANPHLLRMGGKGPWPTVTLLK